MPKRVAFLYWSQRFCFSDRSIFLNYFSQVVQFFSVLFCVCLSNIGRDQQQTGAVSWSDRERADIRNCGKLDKWELHSSLLSLSVCQSVSCEQYILRDLRKCLHFWKNERLLSKTSNRKLGELTMHLGFAVSTANQFTIKINQCVVVEFLQTKFR